MIKLQQLNGFAFDLDGTLWAGNTLLPGAGELVAELRESGKRVLFLTNSSRYHATELCERLNSLGIEADESEVLAALDLLGEMIRRQLGRVKVLPLGTGGMIHVLEASGHEVVGFESEEEIEAVAVGNDPHFDFARLRVASRAIARGAGFFTANMDPRLPVAPGVFDPGCGALTEAIAVAAGVRPVVIGKPHRPIFELALERLACDASEVAMIGDSLGTDIAGGKALGMFTIWLDPSANHTESTPADLTIRDLGELRELWHEARA